MDNTLQKILHLIEDAIELTVFKYKQTKDIKYIEISIEELDKMITMTKDENKSGTEDFLLKLQGMKDELNTIYEMNVIINEENKNV